MNVQEYNAQIINEYLIYKKNVPQSTYKSISADCKAIEKYLFESNTMITSLSGTNQSEQFLIYLTEKYTPATVKRRLCTLRSMLYWCQEQGYIPHEQDINIHDNLELAKMNFAQNTDIERLYDFCRYIGESDEYTIARAKLECLMVIICGFKVSELKKLRIQDVNGSVIDDKMKMVCCTKSECIDTFLQLRAKFTDLWLIKSDILFVNKYGNENEQINLDYELIRKQCNVSKKVTLSSIRNSCIKECSVLLNNDVVASKLFDVTFQWLKKIKEQDVNKKNSLTNDEILLLQHYRMMTPDQKKDVIQLMENKLDVS